MAKKKEVKSQEIRTTRIVIEDDAGKDRIVMGIEQDQPIIKLIGKQGDVQIQLSITADEDADVALGGPRNNPILRLSVADMDAPAIGHAAIGLYGDYPNQGRKEVVIFLGDSVSEPSISLSSNGSTIARLPPINVNKSSKKKTTPAKPKATKALKKRK